MKGRTIILDHIHGLEAAALLVDGKLDDLLIDHQDNPRPGTIYRGICDRPIKGQGGMMMRLPDGATGFLRQGKGLRPGQTLLLQVTGYAEDGKAVPVTDRILFKSRFAIITPGKPGINVSRQITDDDKRDTLRAVAHETYEGDHGLILRSSCETGDEAEIADDITAMASLAEAVLAEAEGSAPETLSEGDGPHLLAWREWHGTSDIVTQPGGFENRGVLDQLAELKHTKVSLGDGFMFVEPTRALVAIDVNTGGDVSPAAALKANLAAARALPRALRLRGLAGQVVVDFVSISKAHRRQVEQSLRAAFKADPIETSLVGWSPMGLFELQRKRERLSLPASLFKDL
ncbi:ribonuclease E/G [Cognatiyoonia sp. IB215446]|uniref:ribonuclease E/G n=1 Tax=Cognatiyoonia sp. IB215446 TaxID=3097355 RepID=UPI002A10127F|nr:ribonuclease E/G [Cognatiyoonia sp. IB215446]MDX8347362.1 ribonuclease E/G [Cognatiyoonia sp. IB215446]